MILAAASGVAGNLAAVWAQSAAVASLVAGVFMIGKALIDRRGLKDVKPSDQNEATRLGNEFLSSLLKEAREERGELRATIKALEADGTTKQERIDSLLTLAEKKDRQITALEARAEAAARKLTAGITLTIVDILGPQHQLIAELELGDDTITT